MEVLNKPELGEGEGQPESHGITASNTSVSKPKKKGLLYGGRENKVGFIAGRAAFVLVGTMFLVMVLFSFLMLFVSINEPYLQPFVVNDKLYQDKIYLQVDGEATYRELIVVTQPGDYDQREITQLPAGKGFKIIFTTKQLEVPEYYYVTYLNGPQKSREVEGGYTRQSKYLRDDKFYTLTVSPNSGAWPVGQYSIDAPSGGMFGGRYYAYFTVVEPGK